MFSLEISTYKKFARLIIIKYWVSFFFTLSPLFGLGPHKGISMFCEQALRGLPSFLPVSSPSCLLPQRQGVPEAILWPGSLGFFFLTSLSHAMVTFSSVCKSGYLPVNIIRFLPVSGNRILFQDSQPEHYFVFLPQLSQYFILQLFQLFLNSSQT